MQFRNIFSNTKTIINGQLSSWQPTNRTYENLGALDTSAGSRKTIRVRIKILPDACVVVEATVSRRIRKHLDRLNARGAVKSYGP